MGQLKEIIELLRKDYLRVTGTKYAGTQISRMVVRRIINKYDLTRAEKMAPWAIGESGAIKPKPKKREQEARANNPGKFDVVFINRHTRQTQILTRKKGIPYDVAELYYNYVSYFGSEKYNEMGHYEIREHEKITIPEDPHFGL